MAKVHLVQQISMAAAIPANRPIDHLRRTGTGMFVGVVGGTVATVLFGRIDLTNGKFLILLVAMVVVSLAFLVPWLLKPPVVQGIPVVARTLGTDETPYQRYVQRGGKNQGLLVPVVVHPLDGSPNFRSVILLKGVDAKEPQDPPVGMLLALQQTEPGMGELSNVVEVTPEQEKVIERLRKHPKQLANEASILPMRRGTMERSPWWAALQWWGSIALGGLLALGLVLLIAG